MIKELIEKYVIWYLKRRNISNLNVAIDGDNYIITKTINL